MDPTGRVALVTGGASGIGLAICEGLLQQKVKGVVFCDVNTEQGNQKVEELEKKYGSGRAFFFKADVRNYDQLEEVFKQAKKKFGQLDILVNSAGILDEANWEREVDIDLNGVIRGTLLAFKYMGKSNGDDKEGIVVNIASVTGVEIGVYDTVPIYCAVKHAVVGLTRALGTPMHFDRTGVRVVAICPGPTSTSLLSEEVSTLDKCLSLDGSWNRVSELRGPQPAECVSRGVIQIIREAPNGSLWVSQEGEPIFQVVIPDLSALKV